jgi:hypothetical protein
MSCRRVFGFVSPLSGVSAASAVPLLLALLALAPLSGGCDAWKHSDAPDAAPAVVAPAATPGVPATTAAPGTPAPPVTTVAPLGGAVAPVPGAGGVKPAGDAGKPSRRACRRRCCRRRQGGARADPDVHDPHRHPGLRRGSLQAAARLPIDDPDLPAASAGGPVSYFGSARECGYPAHTIERGRGIGPARAIRRIC